MVQFSVQCTVYSKLYKVQYNAPCTHYTVHCSFEYKLGIQDINTLIGLKLARQGKPNLPWHFQNYGTVIKEARLKI